MRLFFAIPLPDPVKDTLCVAIARLREASLKGHFTRRDNLHLTLVFLGETSSERLGELSQVMNSVTVPPFSLAFSHLERFQKKERDIWWVGVGPSAALRKVHRDLSNSLVRFGFKPEDRPYVPHLTLGREIITVPGFDSEAVSRTIPPLAMQADRILLMQSGQVNGNLTYTEILQHLLKNPDRTSGSETEW